MGAGTEWALYEEKCLLKPRVLPDKLGACARNGQDENRDTERKGFGKIVPSLDLRFFLSDIHIQQGKKKGKN